MTLSAVYSLLLAKYTGQKDIVVGTSVAGRRHGDLDDIIGMFVNMLPIRNFVEENKTFEEFLREVKENALHAFENQDYQFEELIAKLGLQGLFSRHPLFDTIFVLQTVSDEEENINFEVIPFEVEKRFSHFDISFLALETRETINVEIEYSKALFKSSTIKKMSDHYIEILKQVVNNHHILVKDITLSSGFREAQSRGEDDDYANFGF
jgi:surfactin family lipopeptide synthetase A/fengycin family lipopeptide synthetase D/gramicidin S synthase 2